MSLDGMVILQGVVWGSGREWASLGQVPLASTCYQGNDTSGSIKGVNFLEQLSDYPYLKANSAQRNKFKKWDWSSPFYRLVGRRWCFLLKVPVLILFCIWAYYISYILSFQNTSCILRAHKSSFLLIVYKVLLIFKNS